jgi:cysteine synthase
MSSTVTSQKGEFIDQFVNIRKARKVQVRDEDTFEMRRHLDHEEGILGGISSDAAAHTALQVAQWPREH